MVRAESHIDEEKAKKPDDVWPVEKELVEDYVCTLCAFRVRARFKVVGERRR